MAIAIDDDDSDVNGAINEEGDFNVADRDGDGDDDDDEADDDDDDMADPAANLDLDPEVKTKAAGTEPDPVAATIEGSALRKSHSIVSPSDLCPSSRVS